MATERECPKCGRERPGLGAPCVACGPPAEAVGWCHTCETYQRGSSARHARPEWTAGLWWLCVTPGCDEPWGLGVWDAADYCDCAGRHADDQAAGYPGSLCGAG